MRVVIFAVFASLILAGCLPTVVTDRGGPTASGEFAKGQIVKGFPSLPAYPKAQIVETYGSKEGFGGSFVSYDELAKVVNFYGLGLGQLGWETVLRQKSETNYVYEIKNDTYVGEVIINTASNGKQTAITVVLESR